MGTLLGFNQMCKNMSVHVLGLLLCSKEWINFINHLIIFLIDIAYVTCIPIHVSVLYTA